MKRAIWKGSLSFGLVNIPVALFGAEAQGEELHFHLLDKRNNARIHYTRINEVTQKEVPWENIVKAYEFEKGNYIIVDEKELEKTAQETSQAIEIDDFIYLKDLDVLYFDKPYYLIAEKYGEKGYAVLRDTLEKTHKVGIAKVVIRTRQHLAAILPYKNMLILNLLRFPNEIISTEELPVSKKEIKSATPTLKEIKMAEQLIDSMSVKWNPKKYHDNSRELLKSWIDKKIKGGKSVATKETSKKARKGKIIDFTELLKKSLQEKKKHKQSYTHKTHHQTTEKKRTKGSKK